MEEEIKREKVTSTSNNNLTEQGIEFKCDTKIQKIISNSSKPSKLKNPVKQSVGRWTIKEHEQFISCLKLHGKNWEMLEEMIPTRSNLQIRSHAQKFFERICKEFNTDEPLEYAQMNMCDNSKVYKFDHFKQEAENSPKEFNLNSKINNLQNHHDSSKLNNPEESTNKRILKMNRNNLKMLEDYQSYTREKVEQQITQNNDEKWKEFAASSYIVCDEQKNMNSNNSKSCNFQKNESNTDSNGCSNTTTNYISLDNGSVFIKGNEVETVVPWDIEQINNHISLISPRYPVYVSLRPLHQGQHQKHENRNQSFTSKESHQSLGQYSNVEGPSSISLAANSMSWFLNQSNRSLQNHPASCSSPIDVFQSYWSCGTNSARANQPLSGFNSRSLSNYNQMLSMSSPYFNNSQECWSQNQISRPSQSRQDR